MTAHRGADAGTGQTLVTFELAGDVHDGIVSVVGSFNQWTPGIDVLELQEDGQRRLTVTVEPAADVHFRYLGSGGAWFDDPQAESTEYGSVLRAAEAQTNAANTPSEPALVSAEAPKKGTGSSRGKAK